LRYEDHTLQLQCVRRFCVCLCVCSSCHVLGVPWLSTTPWGAGDSGPGINTLVGMATVTRCYCHVREKRSDLREGEHKNLFHRLYLDIMEQKVWDFSLFSWETLRARRYINGELRTDWAVDQYRWLNSFLASCWGSRFLSVSFQPDSVLETSPGYFYLLNIVPVSSGHRLDRKSWMSPGERLGGEERGEWVYGRERGEGGEA